MTRSKRSRIEPPANAQLVDPRRGDVEDDAASPKQRSLLRIAGSLLVEISLPKLVFAWTVSLLLPAILLGLTPLVATAWLATVSEQFLALSEIGASAALILAVALGWIGWRPLLRIAEMNFWSLNALAVQPGYAFCREVLRHFAERLFARRSTAARQARLRAGSSAAAGTAVCGCAIWISILVWPGSRWMGTVADFVALHRLVVPTLANSIVLVSGYLAIAALAWGLADASMDQPVDVGVFDGAPLGRRTWRVAHLSDLHVVGERYGFRIESGRAGPRGNERFEQVLSRLAVIHAAHAVDLVLVSGDMTDAGRATEWAEFLETVAHYPALAERMIVLPGNHDVNIVDRANPARLDLPFSPGKRLRQMRTLSAMAAVQGDRVQIVDGAAHRSLTLNQALAPHRARIAGFTDNGGLRRAAGLGHLFDDQFPMVLPPGPEGGLGVAILNSNADTHFSFTNALGLVSVEQTHRLAAAINAFPESSWIVALHHHLLEYPGPVAALSQRIGTALINGSWFVRKLRPFADRIVVMHGHRHIDWIGSCGALRIVSAPSPVMGSIDDGPTYFHIHKLAVGAEGRVSLLPPERIDVTAAGSGPMKGV